jgi:hypothetical protein
VRGETLEKVLFHLEKTFKRAIERIGSRILSSSLGDIQSRGLESYQGYLEILFSLLNYQQQGTSGQMSRADPIKLRENSIDFILATLKDRLLDLVNTYTSSYSSD